MGKKIKSERNSQPLPKKSEDQVGTIYGEDTLFFRMDAGTAKDNDGVEYELSTNMGGTTPIVRSLKTQKWFTLTWQDILDLAIKAGINE